MLSVFQKSFLLIMMVKKRAHFSFLCFFFFCVSWTELKRSLGQFLKIVSKVILHQFYHEPKYDYFCFYYLLYLFCFYKNTKIQNAFINIILHKKFMKLKEEKKYIKFPKPTTESHNIQDGNLADISPRSKAIK